MITVSDYKVRETKDGRSFVALELVGGLEMIQSQTTGKFYATTKKCSIPSTFDEATARLMVGSQMPGLIEKQPAEPYTFKLRQTGEEVLLDYSYAYAATPRSAFIGHTNVAEAAF